MSPFPLEASLFFYKMRELGEISSSQTFKSHSLAGYVLMYMYICICLNIMCNFLFL